MFRIALAAILISVPAFANEVCIVVISTSAVDRAFISAVEASPIKHSRPKPEWVCFDESDRTAISRLRSHAQSENPQACVTFEDLSHFEETEKQLRLLAIANWKDKPKTMCYLVKDSVAVEKAVKRAQRPHDG